MAPYEETIYVVVLLGAGAFVAWLVARFATERARERDRRSQVVEQQIARFAETRDFVDFARSDAGEAWIRGGGGEWQVRRGLLTLVAAGTVLTALGAALLVNAARLAGAVDPNDVLNRNGANWWGTVLMAIGLGSLAASFVISRIARTWDRPRDRTGEPEGE